MTWEDQPIRTLSADLDITELRLRYALLCGMYVIYFAAFLRRRWHILLLVGLVVSFVLMTSPNAIWHALTSEGSLDETRASATFGIVAARNANRLAFFCVLALAFIGYAIQAFKSRPLTLLGGSAIVMLVVTIFLSASRSGLLNLGILSVLFLARTGIDRRRIAGLVIVLLVASVAVLAIVPERHLDRITAFFATDRAVEAAGSSGGSNLARLEMLRVGLRMFAENPLLGVGIGNSRWVAVVDYGGVRLSGLHNSYVTALAEGGLLLMAAYLLLFWSVLASLARTRRLVAQAPGLRLGWAVEATWTSFLLLLVFSAFADVWHEVPLFILTGLSIVLERLYRRETTGLLPTRELAAA
jgi:O-antigen ligase